MEHVPGCVVDSDDALAAVAPERRRAIGLSLATTLARIHEVDLAATQLDDPASHKPYAARQLKRWSRQFEDSRIRELPLVTQLAERLRGSMPDQHELTLVHGDYHLLNVITDQQHGGVRAVVDWELATLGDPLADLGGLLAYWPQSDDSLPPAPTPFPAAPGFPSRAELVGAYADASGRCTKAIGFWETLGCWKVAIISEGVLRRAIDRGSDLEASRSARVTEVMLQRAELAANRAGI
jgi:aminoglycoside phosphotransferase (APT) family kinase protein